MAPVTRTLQIGGITKADLRRRLQDEGIRLNPAAEQIFSDDRFTVAAQACQVVAVELSVADLGFAEGATMPRLCQAAHALSLALCPVELGPHLRLQWPDQPEGHLGQALTTHRAPPLSVTVVSAPIDRDDEVPKGFYLRRIDGSLWLRGYRSDDTHVWSPEDRLVFCAPGGGWRWPGAGGSGRPPG